MNPAEDLALSVVSLRKCVRLLEGVAVVYPDAEAQIVAMSMSEETPEGTRAMLKCLHALGTFALAQRRAEETVNVIADSLDNPVSRYVN